MGPIQTFISARGGSAALLVYAVLLIVQLGAAAFFAALALHRRVQRRSAREAVREALPIPRTLHALGALAIGVPAGRRISLAGQTPADRLHETAVAAVRTLLQRKSWSATARRVATGSMLVESRAAVAADAGEISAAIFSKDETVRAYGAFAAGSRAETLPATTIALMSAARERSHGRATITWALQKTLLADPEQILPIAVDPSPVVREVAVACAATVIARLSHRADRDRAEAFRALCRSALQDPAPNVRAAACRAVACPGSDEILPRIVPHLYDDQPDVAAAAADALVTVGTDAAINELLQRLRSAPRPLRAHIARALREGRCHPPPSLVRAVENGDAEAAASCGFLSFTVTDAKLVRTLITLAGDADSERRIAACSALARIGCSPDSPLSNASAREALLRILDKAHDDESSAAVLDALAVSGGDAVVPELMRRIPTSGRFLREKIVESLATIAFLSESGRRRDQRRTTATVVSR